jgi:hypothetical protein
MKHINRLGMHLYKRRVSGRRENFQDGRLVTNFLHFGELSDKHIVAHSHVSLNGPRSINL